MATEQPVATNQDAPAADESVPVVNGEAKENELLEGEPVQDSANADGYDEVPIEDEGDLEEISDPENDA